MAIQGWYKCAVTCCTWQPQVRFIAWRITLHFWIDVKGGLWMLPSMITVLQLEPRLLYFNSDGCERWGTTCVDVSELSFTLGAHLESRLLTHLEDGSWYTQTEDELKILVEEIGNLVLRQLSTTCAGSDNEYLKIQLSDKSISFVDIE